MQRREKHQTLDVGGEMVVRHIGGRETLPLNMIMG